MTFLAASGSAVTIGGASTLTLGAGGLTVESGAAAHAIGAPLSLAATPTTYSLPQGKSLVLGSLGAGTQVHGTLGAAGTGTTVLEGGTKHNADTGELLAGFHGGDVNIHAQAESGGEGAQSLNLFTRDEGAILQLGTANRAVVFAPTWGDSGASSALTFMRKRTGATESDRIEASGDVAIDANTTLDFALAGAFRPAASDTFYLLTCGDAQTGTFRNLAEGAVFKVAGVEYKITYKANWTGNSATSSRSGGNDIAVWPIPAGAVFTVR